MKSFKEYFNMIETLRLNSKYTNDVNTLQQCCRDAADLLEELLNFTIIFKEE